jgi:hypothetical protein
MWVGWSKVPIWASLTPVVPTSGDGDGPAVVVVFSSPPPHPAVTAAAASRPASPATAL